MQTLMALLTVLIALVRTTLQFYLSTPWGTLNSELLFLQKITQQRSKCSSSNLSRRNKIFQIRILLCKNLLKALSKKNNILMIKKKLEEKERNIKNSKNFTEMYILEKDWFPGKIRTNFSTQILINTLE